AALHRRGPAGLDDGSPLGLAQRLAAGAELVLGAHTGRPDSRRLGPAEGVHHRAVLEHVLIGEDRLAHLCLRLALRALMTAALNLALRRGLRSSRTDLRASPVVTLVEAPLSATASTFRRDCSCDRRC